MAFLRLFFVAACLQAALIAGAQANPAPLLGLPGVNGLYGINIPNVLGNAGLGLGLNGLPSQVTLPGVVPHSALPVAATYSVPNSVALPPGLNLPCGLNVPAGLSLPLGLPLAGQPVALTL